MSDSKQSSTSSVIPAADRFTILRALAHLETDEKVRGPDYLAQHCLNQEWQEALSLRSILLKRFEVNAPGAYCYGLARTQFFDTRLSAAIERGVRQVLIFGAGFDTRVYRFSATEPLSFVEFDRLQIQQTKSRRCNLAAVTASRNHVASIPVDFSQVNIDSFLASLDIDYSLPLAMLLEGLLYYLPKRFFKALLRFNEQYAPDGSTLIFDYAHDDILNTDRAPVSLYGAEKVRQFATTSAERFLFTSTPSAIAMECKAVGMKIQDDMDHEQMGKTFLIKSDGSSLGQAFGGFHFCCAIKS